MSELEHALIDTTRMRRVFVTAERLYKSELSINCAARAFHDADGQDNSIAGWKAWIKES
jgi:hypothetical protein